MLTNAYLASKYFANKDEKHILFKKRLTNEMLQYRENDSLKLRSASHGAQVNAEPGVAGHHIRKFATKGVKLQKNASAASMDVKKPERRNNSRFCEECGDQFPLCSPTVRDCFNLHEVFGMPCKRRMKK